MGIGGLLKALKAAEPAITAWLQNRGGRVISVELPDGTKISTATKKDLDIAIAAVEKLSSASTGRKLSDGVS